MFSSKSERTIFESYGDIVAKRLEALGSDKANEVFIDILHLLQQCDEEQKI